MEKNLIRIMPLAILLSACGTGGEDSASYATGQLPTAADVQQKTEGTEILGKSAPAVGEIAVGRAVSPEGAVPETERTDRFAQGEEIHVAVPVNNLAPQSRVRVAWFGPGDDLLAEDTTEVPANEEAQYVSFSMAAREDFDPGEYRAEIWMDDEKIDEQRFAVITNGADNSGGG